MSNWIETIEKENLSNYIDEVRAEFSDFCPALIFRMAEHIAFAHYSVEKWELGMIIWEDCLKTIIRSIEEHIKKMSTQSRIQIKYKDSPQIPIIEQSMMPDIEKESHALTRETQLIKACYLAARIHQDYYDLFLKAMAKQTTVIVPPNINLKNLS